MKRSLKLTFQYYRLLLVYNITFSFVLALFFYSQVRFLNLAFMTISKLLGFIGAVLLYSFTSGNTYLYFRNARVTISALIINALVIDILAFAILATLSTFLIK